MNKFLLYLCIISASISICFAAASAKTINFQDTVFREAVNLDYFRRHPSDGVEIDSTRSPQAPALIFHNPISFRDAHFGFPADFGHMHFDSRANFINVHAESSAVFAYVTFDSMAHFGLAQFAFPANFSHARFETSANFQGTRFDNADFQSAYFGDTAHFGATCFNSWANFTRAQFASYSIFKDARFASSVLFYSAVFDSTANFWSAKFDSLTSFREVRFASSAVFYGARFLDAVSFYKAELPRELDFRFVTHISEEIDLSFALLDSAAPKCQIALVGSNISKIKLDMRLFELWFPADTTWVRDALYKNTDTVESIDSITYDQRIGVYEQVLKKLKDDGFMESYKMLDIDYKRLKYDHMSEKWYLWPVATFLNIFQVIWWNYGYSPELVFLWTFGLWLVIFSPVNLWLYPRLSQELYVIDFLEKKRELYLGKGKARNYPYYGIHVITYTAIIFFGLKMDLDKFEEGAVKNHPALFSYLMLIYASGLFCLGFIVNIIFTR
ncbi:MAG: hypothetical protein NT002_11470 [candidate division Zixibacteria bacterium]|nr:hypothetical protein [candidate division Zixibacteria bacterium]